MNCPKEIRKCPHNWSDCSMCAHERMCIAGLYKPEVSDIEVVIEAAEICEKVVQDEVVEAIEKIRGTWAEKFNAMSEDERWADYFKHHPPSLHDKTPIPLDGPSSPGGGSKSNAKKSKKGNKVFTNIWEGI